MKRNVTVPIFCLLVSAYSLSAAGQPLPIDEALAAPARSARLAALARLAPDVNKTANLIRQIVGDETAIRIYIERNGIVRAARDFHGYAPRLAEEPTQAGERSRRMLANLLTLMREAMRPGDNRTRWDGLFQELRAVREFHGAVHRHLSPVDNLLWLEGVHRVVESDLAQHPNDARLFLAGKPTSLDALWLRSRLDRLALRQPNPDILALVGGAESGPHPGLDRLLRARIAAYAATDPATRKTAIASYCTALRDFGLAREITLDENDAPVDWYKEFHAAPGCLTIHAPENASGTIVRFVTENDVDMAFDSVVRAAGVNISVNAGRFDGSLFDLSANDLPAPASETPEERGAAAGGSLTIDVRHEDHSLLPGFVSFGAGLPPGSADLKAAASDTPGRVNGLLSFLVNGELRTL